MSANNQQQKQRRLPPLTAIGNDASFKLIDDYKIFDELKSQIHESIGNFTSHRSSAPLSTVSGYVDRSFFVDANTRSKQRML